MGSVYQRKVTRFLYVSYTDRDGKRKQEATPYLPGQEKQAARYLEQIEKQIAAEKELLLSATPASLSGVQGVTVALFAEIWGKKRNKCGESWRKRSNADLARYVLPVIGEMPLREVRVRHIEEIIITCEARSKRGKLAPRSIQHLYRELHKFFKDAVSRELIDSNPVTLESDYLPVVNDADPLWRHTAVFDRREVERMLSDPRVPDDMRVAVGLAALGGLRSGETAALTWESYQPELEPLGRLLVAKSWQSHELRLKSTKTGVVRNIPVHPALAAILAEWKLSGWAAFYGRAPTPEDFILPTPLVDGTGRVQKRMRHFAPRSSNFTNTRFKDLVLAPLDLRKRRYHDLRRTFISLALGDGARRDHLSLITHPPKKDSFDLYITLPWAALCEAVAHLRIDLTPAGKLVPLPLPAVVTAP